MKTKMQITVTGWRWHVSGFLKDSGGRERFWMDYEAEAIYDTEQSLWVRQELEKIGQLGTSRLLSIGLLFGVGSRLKIGQCNGVIAPSLIERSGWEYPSGEPMEESFYLAWQPTEEGQDILNQESNEFKADLHRKYHFKWDALWRIPPLFEETDRIPLFDLPKVFRNDLEYVFG